VNIKLVRIRQQVVHVEVTSYINPHHLLGENERIGVLGDRSRSLGWVECPQFDRRLTNILLQQCPN